MSAAAADADLPAARHLLGDGATHLVATALAVEGARLERLQRRQVLHRPGRCLVARYKVQVVGRDGLSRRETLVAVADRSGPPPGTLVLEADDVRVGLFRFPHDPLLPGLAPVVDPATAGALVGLPGPVRVEVRTYRPTQRAVVRLTGADGTDRWAKALPLADVGEAVDRHRAVAGIGTPPVLVGDAGRGLLVLGALPGRSVRELLEADGRPQPDPTSLLAVLARLGAAPVEGPVGRASPLAAAGHHAALLGHVLPTVRPTLDALQAALGPDGPVGPATVVHGDLHPAQVLADDRGVATGLLDLDDVGVGQPVDDLAGYLGHLACTALRPGSERVAAHLAAATAAFEAVVDPAELHRRTAAVVLGLATGPYRVQEPDWEHGTRQRLALARRWLACAAAGGRPQM